MKRATVLLAFAAALLVGHREANACTNFLITRDASADGSTMITYAADSHVLYGELYYTPAGRHLPGDTIEIHEWDTGDHLGSIPQVEETYSVVGNINEHQVAIGETTWGGREELKESEGVLDYGSLMYIALQRARTAREAIEVMTSLVEEHGYASSGETFSISDPYEVWIMEMIGKGKEEKGALWVARRIPEGYVAAHANQARIRTFPLNKKKQCLYADDVVDFAREKGWYEGPDEEFSFAGVYAPLTWTSLRFCEARVWAFYNRVAPSLELDTGYIDGDEDAEPLPLYIEPDRKLSVHDVMELMRDHFEGTKWDLSKGVGAGPHELPYRWRPLVWDVEEREEGEDGEDEEEKKPEVQYVNERSTSTQQTGFSFVAQSRFWLPDPVGGVLWFGVDDTYSTVYVPMYCGIREAPEPYAVGTGSFDEFSWDSAFWVFNFVSNYSYLRYKDMIQDVRRVQKELESNFIARRTAVEEAAVELHDRAPELARDYLTEYSTAMAEETVERYRELGEFLLWKYLDGNVKDEHGEVEHPGYPRHWYERIIEERGDHFRLRKLPGEPEEDH
ncbi:MAG: C69 family dipeptidase [Polyangia bacterium]